MSNPKMYADQLIEVIEKSVFVSWDPEIWHVVFCLAGTEMCGVPVVLSRAHKTMGISKEAYFS
jgi:hypothetical protein